jgi:hypothetical protein
VISQSILILFAITQVLMNSILMALAIVLFMNGG